MIIVADATPLIGLARIDQLDLEPIRITRSLGLYAHPQGVKLHYSDRH